MFARDNYIPRLSTVQRTAYRLARLWLALAAALPALANSDVKLQIESTATDQVRIRFQTVDASIDPHIDDRSPEQALRVNRDAQQRLPAFVRVIPLESGRWAEVTSLASQSRIARDWPDSVDSMQADEDLIDVSIARMGRRVFLRIEVRPFQPESGRIREHYRIDAGVRIAQAPPPRRVAQDAGTPRWPLEAADSSCEAGCPPPVPASVPDGVDGTPDAFSARRSVTNPVAWKLAVHKPGMYRVTGAQLAAAGVPDALLDTSRLRLSSRDRMVPYWRSVNGPMTGDDWLMFYGAAVASATTTQNVYWLSAGNPSPIPQTVSAVPSAVADPLTSSWHAVTFAPKALFRAAFNPLDERSDHWFAMEVAGGTVSNIALATPHPAAEATEDAFLTYTLYGTVNVPDADPDQRSILRVGNLTVTDLVYTGRVKMSATVAFPAAAITPGVTTVSVEQVVLPGVVPAQASALIESISLCYPRRLTLETLPYTFRGNVQPTTVRLDGLPTEQIRLLDLSDPLQPLELTGWLAEYNDPEWSISFNDAEGGGRCFGVFPKGDGVPSPSIETVRFRNLSNPSRQADYLVVTPRAFREPVYRLLKHRYLNGLTVQVATPDDIYHEFGYGLADPAAIRQYIGYAYHHYQAPEPRYVLLVGIGTYDPLDRLDNDEPEWIPVKMGAAPWRWTAHEQWFVTVDGNDRLPDLAIGRIPARTVSDIEQAVSKILAFDRAPIAAPWRRTSLLVADQADAVHDFKAHARDRVAPRLVQAGFDELFGIQTAYRDDLTQTQVRQTIQGALQTGVHMVHYSGHGGVRQWASPSVWHRDDALAAENAIHPITVVFTCQNGLFFDPGETGLAQAMLFSEGGASAIVAPSALAVQLFSEHLADGFYDALAAPDTIRLGDAMMNAFLQLWTFNPNVAELRFYTIFGDPAQSLWGGLQP